MNRIPAAFALCPLCFALCAVAPAHAATSIGAVAVGDLLISEVMVNPAKVADSVGEWFELHNRSRAAIDLAGLVVSSGGTRTDETFTVTGNHVLDSGGFAVFARSGDPAVNGGVTADIVYRSALSFGNAVDWLRIGRPDGSALMEVQWDTPEAGRGLDVRQVHFPQSEQLAFLVPSGLAMTYGRGDTGSPGRANLRDIGVTGLAAVATPTPEPGTWAMLGAGLAALGVAGRRGRRGARFA
ncbi:MAG: lamin tail domain-containing protein [Burkholderiales bacterium]|nr:lamin tail domain-containing protein [Burkholderiales bacterium]